MSRLCERPGCSEPAAVSYGLDAAHQLVVLAADPVDEHARTGVLCRRHADSMVVPLGWTLDDRREPVPRLFTLSRRSDEAPRPRTRRVRPAAQQADAELPLFDEPADAKKSPRDEDLASPMVTVAAITGEESVAEPDETRAIPWNPHFDTTDDLDGLLAADTPLLARAFGNARRRPRRR